MPNSRKISAGLLSLLAMVIFISITGCSPKKYAVAIETPASGFTVVLLPDTQFYAKRHPDIYYQQTRWIVAHKDELNIKFVVHLGDITHNNTLKQWQVADKAHKILDQAGIPYSIIPGNHDMPKTDTGRVRDTSRFNSYFGPSRFEDQPWYGGHLGATNENHYAYFEAGHLNFMVVGLEYAPTGKALLWANKIIDQHKDHRTLVVTHCYQAKSLAGKSNGGEHQKNCASRYNLEGSNGQEVWAELVSRHANIFLVLCGHVSDVEHKRRVGLAGNPVHEILTDYQSERPGGDEDEKKSGNGWLRTLQFFPKENKINVRSYSVIGETRFYHTSRYNQNPSHPDHSYTIEYDMTAPTP